MLLKKIPDIFEHEIPIAYREHVFSVIQNTFFFGHLEIKFNFLERIEYFNDIFVNFGIFNVDFKDICWTDVN